MFFLFLFRLVYETTYRDVVIPKNTSQVIYICCPGWSQIDKKSYGCNKRKYMPHTYFLY